MIIFKTSTDAHPFINLLNTMSFISQNDNNNDKPN